MPEITNLTRTTELFSPNVTLLTATVVFGTNATEAPPEDASTTFDSTVTTFDSTTLTMDAA